MSFRRAVRLTMIFVGIVVVSYGLLCAVNACTPSTPGQSWFQWSDRQLFKFFFPSEYKVGQQQQQQQKGTQRR